MITESKLSIGIYFTYLLIFVQVLYGLTFLPLANQDLFSLNKEILFQVSSAYLYISILMIVRRVISKTHSLWIQLTWIIRLQVLSIISQIIGRFLIKEVELFSSLLAIPLFVLYIMFIVNLHNDSNKEKYEVVSLKPFVLTIIIASFIAAFIAVWIEFQGTYILFLLQYIVISIPYLFLISYFKKLKKRLHESMGSIEN